MHPKGKIIFIFKKTSQKNQVVNCADVLLLFKHFVIVIRRQNNKRRSRKN